MGVSRISKTCFRGRINAEGVSVVHDRSVQSNGHRSRCIFRTHPRNYFGVFSGGKG